MRASSSAHCAVSDLRLVPTVHPRAGAMAPAVVQATMASRFTSLMASRAAPIVGGQQSTRSPGAVPQPQLTLRGGTGTGGLRRSWARSRTFAFASMRSVPAAAAAASSHMASSSNRQHRNSGATRTHGFAAKVPESAGSDAEDSGLELPNVPVTITGRALHSVPFQLSLTVCSWCTIVPVSLSSSI